MEHDGRREGEVDPAAENAQLREALSSRAVIEQAKGMVMLVRACSAVEAFAVLVAVSQQTNVKLRDVATVVVAAGSATEPGLPDADAEREVRAALCAHVRQDLGTGEAGRRPAAGSAEGFKPRRFSSGNSAPGVSGTKSVLRE